MARRHDEKIRMRVRTAYIIRNMSAAECAEEFSIHERTIKGWASKEGWAKERFSNRTDATQVVIDELRGAVADDLAQHKAISAKVLTISDLAAVELEYLATEIPKQFATAQKAAENARNPLEVLKFLQARSRMLRGLVETGARIEQWTNGAIRSNRLAHGIGGDQASDASVDADTQKTLQVVIEQAPEFEVELPG